MKRIQALDVVFLRSAIRHYLPSITEHNIK